MLCPVCIANAAMTATGIGSAGGAAAFAVRIFRGKLSAKELMDTDKGDCGNGNEQTGNGSGDGETSQSRIQE